MDMTNIELILIVGGLIGLAFWQRSNFLYIVSGMLAIGFGIYWITVDTSFMYIMIGVGSVGVGIYMVIDVARSYLQGN